MAVSSRSSVRPAAPKTCRLADCANEPVAHRYCDEHLRERMPTEWQKHHKIQGATVPRLWTPPLRPLTRKTTRGYEVIDFANAIGQPLLPWQEWVVIHAFETLPDGSYRFKTVLILVARQNGKSHLKRVVSLWRMYMDGAKQIIGVAQDVALARDQMDLIKDAIHDSPDLEAEWGGDSRGAGNEWFKASSCRYAIKAANRKAGRGGSNDEVTVDELREQHNWDAWGAISKTTMARPKGQLWAMSNAGDDESVVLNRLRDNALAGVDPPIFLAEYSAPDDCALDDQDAWAQANPGLGYTVSHAAIRSALGTDPPAVFRTEVLCQRVDQLDGAFDPGAWRDCHDPAGNMEGLRSRVRACFDIAPDGQHATLVVAARQDDGRIRIEAAGAWTSTDAARDDLGALLARIKPVAVGWFPVGPGAAFAPILRKLTGNEELGGSKVTEACQGLVDLVKARRIVQPGDPLITAQVIGAKRLESGDGFRYTRKGGAGHVDAAYATAGAVYLVETIPDRARTVFRSISF